MNSELTGRQYEQRSMPPSITDLFPMPNTQTDDVSMFHVEMNISQQHMAYDHENHTGTCNFNLSLHNGWYNTTIDLTLWEVANRYTIRLYAKDHAGNSITASLSKAWDAVKSAVNFIAGWILDQIKTIFAKVFEPAIEAIQNWILKLSNVIGEYIEYLNKTSQENDFEDAEIYIENILRIIGEGMYIASLILAASMAIYGLVLATAAFSYSSLSSLNDFIQLIWR